MENTLVMHKTKNLGIGCIAKELKNSYKVNFGTADVLTCNKDAVNIVDTSECKTMTFSEFKRLSATNHISSVNSHVIVGNEVKQYVGIGWITLRVVTLEDLTKYKRIV